MLTPWTRVSVYTLSWCVFVASLHVILFFGSLRASWREWLPAVIVALIFGGLAVLFIWDERRLKAKGLPPDPPLPNILSPVVPYIGFEGIILLLLLVQANGVARSVGRAHAIQQTHFLTVNQPAESVVLRAYDDLLITARFDRASKTVGPDVALISNT